MSLQHGKLYMNGATLISSRIPTPGGGTENYTGSHIYQHKDWLGSVRLTSDIVASTVASDTAYSPYGEAYNHFGYTGTPNYGFTGDDESVLSGMWDTPNRELTNIGRWLNPDPAGAGWNQYAYSTNPLTNKDPTGLQSLWSPGDSPGSLGINQGISWDEFDSPNPYYPSSIAGTYCANYPNDINCSAAPTAAPTAPPTAGNCSQGCVTATAVNTFEGQVVATVETGPDFDNTTIQDPKLSLPSLLLAASNWLGKALNHPCAPGVSCGIVFPGPGGSSFGNLSLAGYKLAGAWGMVGETFEMNISFSSVEGEGLGALTDEIVSMAQNAGASDVSVTASMITNKQLANATLMARVASQYGWTYQQIDSTTFVLTKSVP